MVSGVSCLCRSLPAVIAPDLIGWGESDHPARDYTTSDYWLMIAELLRMLGTPVTVVASSLTAGIVVRLAIQQPPSFSAFVFGVSERVQ